MARSADKLWGEVAAGRRKILVRRLVPAGLLGAVLLVVLVAYGFPNVARHGRDEEDAFLSMLASSNVSSLARSLASSSPSSWAQGGSKEVEDEEAHGGVEAAGREDGDSAARSESYINNEDASPGGRAHVDEPRRASSAPPAEEVKGVEEEEAAVDVGGLVTTSKLFEEDAASSAGKSGEGHEDTAQSVEKGEEEGEATPSAGDEGGEVETRSPISDKQEHAQQPATGTDKSSKDDNDAAAFNEGSDVDLPTTGSKDQELHSVDPADSKTSRQVTEPKPAPSDSDGDGSEAAERMDRKRRKTRHERGGTGDEGDNGSNLAPSNGRRNRGNGRAGSSSKSLDEDSAGGSSSSSSSHSKGPPGLKILEDWMKTKARQKEPVRKIGLVNIATEDVPQWLTLKSRQRNVIDLPFPRPPPSLTWDNIFPVWIDEMDLKPCFKPLPWAPWAGPGNGTVLWPIEEFAAASAAPPPEELDVLVVALPCAPMVRENASWARDVLRLQLQLMAMSAAAAQKRSSVGVLLLTLCPPLPNVFHCSQLVATEAAEDDDGHTAAAWLYAVEPQQLRDKFVGVPVGSCSISEWALDGQEKWHKQLPFRHPQDMEEEDGREEEESNGELQQHRRSLRQQQTRDLLLQRKGGRQRRRRQQLQRQQQIQRKRYAFATMLHGTKYLCGVLALAQGLRDSGTRHDLVLLLITDDPPKLGNSTAEEGEARKDSVGPTEIEALEQAGWKIVRVGFVVRTMDKGSFCKLNYAKIHLWALTQYDKVVFLDADVVVMRNMDHVFRLPEMAAVGNDGPYFNAGFFLLSPSLCMRDMLLQLVNQFDGYRYCDQGFLNEVFPWWVRYPYTFNYYKYQWQKDPPADKVAERLRVITADPPILHVMHYYGTKPWECPRMPDFDCNRLLPWGHPVVDENAMAIFWRIHDHMPSSHQVYCQLRLEQLKFLHQEQQKMIDEGHWDPKFWNVTLPPLPSDI